MAELRKEMGGGGEIKDKTMSGMKNKLQGANKRIDEKKT